MNDYVDDCSDRPDEDAAEAGDESVDGAADLQEEDDPGELAEVKAMIAAEYARGQLTRDRAEDLLGQTRDLEQRMEQDHQQLAESHFPDDFDAFLAGKAMFDQHIRARRAIEFATLGIHLGGLASDWDHMLKNLSCPEQDEQRARHAAMWRSLSREQQADFKQRLLAKGELSDEELDRLIEEQWE